MNYKIIFVIFFLFNSCVPVDTSKKINFNRIYSNSGFALVYKDEFFKEKIISKKIDNRSLIIFSKRLKPNSYVKVTNLLNNKSIIAKVGQRSDYPPFYNSVLSLRVSEDIELNLLEPYVSITQINKNSTFIADKSKTYKEERNVAEKVPILEIGIKDLSTETKKINKTNYKKKFSYVIKVADFYYEETAKMLAKRINNEVNIQNVNISKLSQTKFRVFLGPYYDLISLKENFNKVLKLDFENLEILKI